MQTETGKASAELEAGEGELVERDDCQPGQCDRERVVVEEGDAEQRQGEQYEVDRNTQKIERFNRRSPGRGGGRR